MTQSYLQRQWEVVEYPFRPHDLPHTETIFTQGNGLVGVRGSFEEGYLNDQPLTLAAGIFNHTQGTIVPELVSLPNWLSLNIVVNGETFNMKNGKLLGYKRVLDLKTAVLNRGVLWRSPNGDTVRFAFERFTSLHNQHVMGLRLLVQVLNEGDHTIEVTSALDGTALNPGDVDHWQALDGSTEGDTLLIAGTTNQSGYTVAMRASLEVEGKKTAIKSSGSATRKPAHSVTVKSGHNEKVVFTKLVALHTTRDSADPVAASQETLKQAVKQGYDALKAAHEGEWAQYWDDMDIIIEGDEIAQRSVRFCTYHILIAAPRIDEGVSIAAKTLSGHGYKGHVFWDTELFILPPLTIARPDLSRRMLMYRYNNLQGARNKALEAGYKGAMFPWESTDTGEETTPRIVTDVLGNEIRIWTGDNEQHISTDIAYAVLQYWQWTGDDVWFRQYGAEIVLDTAKFWGSRAEWNAEKARFELRQQIGPDEYHENVDNSVFTNSVVQWHLRQAAEVYTWLKKNAPSDLERLSRALEIDEQSLVEWHNIADKMWIPMRDGVLEQFENFFQRLKPINLEDYTPRTTNMDAILGHAKTQVSRVIKQADVVMLMYFLGEQFGDKDFQMKNWELYSQVVDHGSSLSPSIHALVAARLGLIEQAYDYFIYAATIDLDDHKGNVHDGIHAASCGGVWQAIVLGFCGLELTKKGIKTNPRLPDHWRRVSFKVYHEGKQHTISVP